jgi:hypothetical protein
MCVNHRFGTRSQTLVDKQGLAAEPGAAGTAATGEATDGPGMAEADIPMPDFCETTGELKACTTDAPRTSLIARWWFSSARDLNRAIKHTI